MNKNCPWCDKEMHMDAVRVVKDGDATSLGPGTYHALHCVTCRRTFHQRQDDKETVKV